MLSFFEHNSWLLTDPRFEAEAHRQVALHRRSLARAERRAIAARKALLAERTAQRRRVERRELSALRRLEPRAAICKVFGRYCEQALRVSRCESGLRVEAQNGQYIGLFQMGADERRLFGHGSTPIEQARAAHRYFVSSGRDWSPWSCKPW